ncbi:MAG: hypothetical protein EBU08_04035 [Micrococcales bacterium]|nr:hypothetical protein [Micrococcales bacterium]
MICQSQFCINKQLQAGEFAINIADGAVFIKTTADEIVDLLTYTFADGGVITAPEIGILRLRTETGDRLVTATGEYINVDQNND